MTPRIRILAEACLMVGWTRTKRSQASPMPTPTVVVLAIMLPTTVMKKNEKM